MKGDLMLCCEIWAGLMSEWARSDKNGGRYKFYRDNSLFSSLYKIDYLAYFDSTLELSGQLD